MGLFDSVKSVISSASKAASSISKNSSSGKSSSVPTAPVVQPFNGMSNEEYINNMTGKINSMYDAQKTSQLQALQNARDAATSQYQRSIDTADQQYAPLRDQASQFGQKSLLANKELMAQQGLFNSGDNVTAQTNINNQTAKNINDLNTQKASYINNIQWNIDQLKANGVKEDTNLLQQLEAAKMQAMLDLANNADNRSFRLYDIQNQAAQQNFQNQMARYNTQMNTTNMQHNWNQDDLNNQFRNSQFDYQKTRDQNSDKQWQQQYNLQDRNSQWENSRWAQEFERQGQWHDQAQALAAARAASGGSGRGGGRSSGRSSGGGGDYSNTDYKNSSQQTLHDYTNNNNYSLAQKLQALSGYANSSGVDSKDAQYANEQKQALLDGRWYEGRYK